MEPNWGLYNSYYSGDRQAPVSPHNDRSDVQPSHRRSMNQGVFLPPPPPQQGQPGLPLPPVSTSYGGSNYHSSSSAMGMGPGGQGSSGTGSQSAHLTPGMPYSSHMPPMSQQLGTYHYPMQSSPATMSALPPSRQTQPHGYSPRIPGGYPAASPSMTTLSPLSPSAHMGYPSSAASASSNFPPSVPPPHSKVDLPSMSQMKKRRTNSTSEVSSVGDKMDRDDDEQPWGMPQDQYKALNPRDKKQVRNRIGARRFRAKRKDYVSSLEASKKEGDQKIIQLEAQLEQQRREINDLRARLNLPPSVDSGLGLVVSNNDH